MPLTMQEVKIAEQKQIENGCLFPKVVIPGAADQYHNSKDEEMATVLGFIRKEKDWIQHELHESGALLFRGFKCLKSASEFNAFVDAFGWEEHPYKGAAPRNNVVGRVWTANEAPLDQDIFFHHEMALVLFHYILSCFRENWTELISIVWIDHKLSVVITVIKFCYNCYYLSINWINT